MAHNKKPHLFLDFDGLKYYTFREFAQYYNQRYSVSITPEDFHKEKDAYKLISRHIEISKEEFYDACALEFLSSESWHSTVEPYVGLCEYLPKIAEKYLVHTVTARQSSGLNTIAYLNHKFVPGCIPYVHCVWQRLPNGDYLEIPKIDYIIENIDGYGIFIDDTPEEVMRAQGAIRSILFDPHDAFGELIGIHERVTSWKEISELLL